MLRADMVARLFTPALQRLRSARLGSAAPHAEPKSQFDFSPEEWSDIYTSGRHRHIWDVGGPSSGAAVLTALFPANPGARLLEIGCGSGADSIHFAKNGYRVLATDIGESAVEHARSRARSSGAPPIDWIVADIRHPELDLMYDDFELAYDRGCLHCLSLADWPAYARNVHRVLKPNAPLFVFSCGVAESAHFTSLTTTSLEALAPWFSVEKFDEVQLCSATGHLPGAFALLRRDG